MRNLDIITKEIVELSEIRSAYNHYLASNRSLTEVENTTQIQYNKQIINKTLNSLYAEQTQVKQAIKAFTERQSAIKTIYYTNDEKNAILHFNRDRRFTITE